MRPLLRREESRAFDRLAEQGHGVPGRVLMENAGRGATDALLARFGDRLGRVVCVGGPGQNGGDAWVVARRLASAGVDVSAWLLGDESRLRGDAAPNWACLRSLSMDVQVAGKELLAFGEALRGATLIVDGVFGTGLDRPVTGRYAQVLERMDEAAAPKLALDLPSGLDANTGAALGRPVSAALTVSFGAHKVGLFQGVGARVAGERVVADLGVPAPRDTALSLLEVEDLARWLPRRAPDIHKGTAGHVLIVAGSEGKSGAAWLCARGALRAGAGLVTLATRDPEASQLAATLPEAMVERLRGDASRALELLAERRVAVVGPGLGLDEEGAALVRRLALEPKAPVILDADALTLLAREGVEQLADAQGPRVLTPHPGEAARLLNCSTADIARDRVEAAISLARRATHVVVLKGAGTVVARPDGRAVVCPRGTPAMATAGSGDVLAGILGALSCALAPFEAASASTLLHALAGEAAAHADRGLLSHEIADAVPGVIAAL